MLPDDARARLADHAGRLLDLWGRRGWDATGGGWHERLDPAREPVPAGFRRLMVCGRMMYLFSAGRPFGDPERGRALARRTLELARDRLRDPVHGGWWFSIGPGGAPLDRKKDLYGHAFAIFGLSHVARVWNDGEARDLALRSRDEVERRFLLPEGWYAAAAGEDWRIDDRRLSQNPHMHLLEAYLALAEATQDERAHADARRLVELFAARICDGGGRIREHFDAHGAPDPTDGQRLEPGHHFEWYWLLDRHREVTGDRRWLGLADAVLARGRTGLDPEHGGVWDEVDARSGAVLVPTKRIWPVLEGIKAHAVRLRHTGAPADLERLLDLVRLLDRRYLRPDGGTVERLDRAMNVIDATCPASTGYHVLMAVLEVMRALPAA